MTNASIQQQLINFGLLDPPADGRWGAQSQAALEDFQTLFKQPVGKRISPFIENMLAGSVPELNLGNDLASKIICYMMKQGYFISRGPQRYNIIYIEGVDSSGNLNSDTLNEWNDRRIILEIPDLKTPQIVGNWLATTEPGATYTYAPMNPGGAFRIAFGQYCAWTFGLHGRTQYPALVQCAEVSGYRDANMDGIRTGDLLVKGAGFGINQHHGWNLQVIDEGSAGCLVGQSIEGHYNFLEILKRDRRYQINPSCIFYTTIIPGDKLA